MFRATRLCALALLALALLTAPALAQTEEVVTDAPADAPMDVSDLPALPIVEIPLYVGTTRADFGVYEGENLNDAAEKFGVAHALSPESLASLKDEVARRLLSITEAINANRAQSADAKQLLFEVPTAQLRAAASCVKDTMQTIQFEGSVHGPLPPLPVSVVSGATWGQMQTLELGDE